MAAGASNSTPPLVLINTADAFTRKYFAPMLVDAWGVPSTSWWRITRNGVKTQGSAIVVPVSTGEDTSGGAYWGAQIVDTNMVDNAVPAQWEWKGYSQPIVIPYTDVLLNSGPTQVIDIIKAKEEIASSSLLHKLSRGLWGTAPQNTSLDLDSLPAALASASNTYAAIDRSAAANAFWRPQIDATAEAISYAAMQRVYGTVTVGNEEPDTILLTQPGFNAFWALNVANIRYPDPDQETIRAGFRRHMVFNNAVVLHDSYITAASTVGAYFLNSKYIEACFLANDYFTVDPFAMPTNQRVLISHIWVTMNVKVFNPRMCATHTGFNND
jgi:hypothetical protein